MYDYFRELGEQLSEEQLVEVLGKVALLNEQPFCNSWVELIASTGVTGMLKLSKYLGGKTITIPPLYQILMVYAALMVIELNKTVPYQAAKQQVVGGVVLDGFDELVQKIKDTEARLTSGFQ